MNSLYLFNEEYLDKVTISSKGYITFGGTPDDTNIRSLTYGGPLRTIAPLWSNHIPDEDSRVYYLESADKFIVQYSNYTQDDLNFQLILFKDGSILFQYLNGGFSSNFASIGLKGPNYYDGISVNTGSIRSIVPDEYAVHFTTSKAISYFSP